MDPSEIVPPEIDLLGLTIHDPPETEDVRQHGFLTGQQQLMELLDSSESPTVSTSTSESQSTVASDPPVSNQRQSLELQDDSSLPIQPAELSGEQSILISAHLEDDLLDSANPMKENNDDDTDDEKDDRHPQLERTSERRRAQNAKFDSWFTERAESVMKEDRKTDIADTPDEILSLRNLVAKHESKTIITTPREYQVELFERAKTQNTIAVLDTGSGKTLIAVLLLRYVLDQELEDRRNGQPRRVAVFLVDSVNLVFQQAAVLEANLDFSITRICGEMGCDLWSKSTWAQQLENMIIVCTAEVLRQCLLHSFISISEINILIFDEAHHAKKDHAYARIIKDSYLSEPDESKRPRIFGMTASPVDARVDVVVAAQELETLLHCKIATTSDLSLLRRSVSRPQEEVVYFDPLSTPFKTQLCQKLYQQFGRFDIFSKIMRFAEIATSELGTWCADHLWTFALAEEEAQKMEGKVESAFISRRDTQPISVLDENIAKLREAHEIVKTHTFMKALATTEHLSSKVLELHVCLARVFRTDSNAKCIVFVKRRHSAKLLCSLFTHIGSAFMRPGILIGARVGDTGDVKISFKEQMRILSQFRKGQLNCLFATSVAEEGLDIPDCNFIIRFDLYDTMIQYIQSRGRARHLESTYIHMIERGNAMQQNCLTDVRQSEHIMRKFCEGLPADRYLEGNDCNVSDLLLKERSLRVYIDPETKAKLTYGSSLLVLANFIDSLPYDGETVRQLDYVLTSQNGKFVCEVILPATSPIRSAIGRPSSRKAIAKQSAAFEACLLLRQGKYLDANLLSTYEKQLPAMRNALLALNVKKMSTYDMRIKPSLWARGWGICPQRLFMTMVRLSQPEALGRPYQPLGLLTREPLPEFPYFPIYLDQNISSAACISLPTSFDVPKATLKKFSAFTLRLFGDIFNKTYEADDARMSYWIAPISNSVEVDQMDPEQLIDWKTLDTVFKHEELKWSSTTPNSFFANKFLVDKWDGGRRFFSDGVASNLKPLDPVPANTAPGKYNENILDYSISLWTKARKRARFSPRQPVLRVQKVVHRRNWLDHITADEKSVQTLAYVCPEPLKISALPAGVVAMGYIFPAIISRLESYMITLEAMKVLKLDIKAELALEAFTKDSDNTDNPEEATHFERGMGQNYERLEFIGDCFLKMSTSIALFAEYPVEGEYSTHVKRMLMICNKNLLKTATELHLPEYVRSRGFSRRTWYPEGLKLLSGKGHNKIGTEKHQHQLGDKSVADIGEAIIGAALVSHCEDKNMDQAVHAVSVLVNNPDHDVHQWSDYYKLYEKPTYQTAASTASQIDLCKKLELEHDYHFQYPRLARSAFIHTSYPFAWERIPTYERLEFLGDSLLDMACVNFLFYRYPKKDPQWLTEHKMAMVSNQFLGALCVRLGFHRHLRSKIPLDQTIQRYVDDIKEAEEASNGARDYWVAVKSPPKCLPDIVEAYVAAVFVDSEFNYQEVERFFERHIRWFFEDMSIYDDFANSHPTTYLTNLLLSKCGCSNIRLLARDIPTIDGTPAKALAAVMIHGEIVAEGQAASGKNAKVRASKMALQIVHDMTTEEFQKKFKCDCNASEMMEEGPRSDEEVGAGTAI